MYDPTDKVVPLITGFFSVGGAYLVEGPSFAGGYPKNICFSPPASNISGISSYVGRCCSKDEFGVRRGLDDL